MPASRPEFSTKAYYDRLQATQRPTLACDTSGREQWQTWQGALSEQLLTLLGGFPATPCPLEPLVLERIETPEYTREKIVFTSEPGAAVPAYLFTPRGLALGQRAPAILCLHGHGRGKDDVVGLTATPQERQRRIRPFNYDYAHQFAQQGYVVLAPDARAFGELGADGMDCTWAMTAGLLLGKVLVGMRVWDAIRALDYLETRPEVDPERLACVGLSWGGTHTLYTAALDRRIKVAIISGYFSTFKDILIDADECPCQYVPNILRYADLPDLVALLAPRAVLIEVGAFDQHYTREIVEASYAGVRRSWQLLGVPERLDLDLFPGGHRFSGDKAFAWVERWL